MSAYEAAVERISLLERLQALRSEGAISEEDFAIQKARVLQHDHTSTTSAAYTTSAEESWVPAKQGFDPDDSRTRTVGLGIVALIVLLFGGYFWFSPAEAVAEEAQVYTVAKTVNVRSAPTTEGSEVVGKFAPGSQFKATPETGSAGQQWVKIVEGRYTGSYVWTGNLQSASDEQSRDSAPEDAGSTAASVTGIPAAYHGAWAPIEDGCAAFVDTPGTMQINAREIVFYEGSADIKNVYAQGNGHMLTGTFEYVESEPYTGHFTRAGTRLTVANDRGNFVYSKCSSAAP